MTEIEIPESVSKIIDDQIEAYPLTPEDRDLHRTKLILFAEFGYRLAASSNTVPPVDNVRWVKASERQPNNKDDRPLKVNDGFVIGWFDEDRKLWITDFDITYHSDEVEWLEEQTNPVDNIVESEEKKVVGEWQLCPKCLGSGTIMSPFQTMSTNPYQQCDVCYGAKIISKPIIEQTKEVSTNLK